MLFRNPLLSIILTLSIIFCLFQITLGGFVRVSESGLGCPDWPLCYGEIIPPMSYSTLIEWGHRTSGVVLGMLILLSTILIWVKKRSDHILLITISTTLLTVIIVGIIGGIVVLSELDPRIRTIHLFFSQLIVFQLSISLVIINSKSISFSLIKHSLNQKHVLLLIFSATFCGSPSGAILPACLAIWICALKLAVSRRYTFCKSS